MQRRIKIYADSDGNHPFLKWLKNLRDPKTVNRILRRLDRLEFGNFGDFKSVGEGVFELRLFFGPGYRLYYAEDGDIIVLILCGGKKDGQQQDIKQAKKFWIDYQERKK